LVNLYNWYIFNYDSNGFKRLEMRKIPRLFLREDRIPIKKVNPECEWVMKGEGRPTRKYNGTSCAIIKNTLYKRYDNKKEKPVQIDWISCGDTSKRGKNLYWIPVLETDKYHLEAVCLFPIVEIFNSYETITFELCGPRVQNNPEKFTQHVLVPHGKTNSEEDSYLLERNPRTMDEIIEVLLELDIEGIVWHNSDGRMCKESKKNIQKML